MDQRDYIHESWKDYDLTNLFIQYNNVIEKLNNIGVEYFPNNEYDILYFLKIDISKIRFVYLKFRKQEITEIEKSIFDNKTLILYYCLNNENIWANVMKEIMIIISDKILFMIIEKNKLINQAMIKNMLSSKIMHKKYYIDEDIIKLMNVIEKNACFVNKYNLLKD